MRELPSRIHQTKVCPARRDLGSNPFSNINLKCFHFVSPFLRWFTNVANYFGYRNDRRILVNQTRPPALTYSPAYSEK